MQAIAEIFNSVFGAGQARETLNDLDRAYRENVRRVERDDKKRGTDDKKISYQKLLGD